MAEPSDKIKPDEEMEAIADALSNLEGDVYPIVQGIAKNSMKARKAIQSDPVDTLTLSNMAVELAILNQRLGERVANALALNRWAKEFYERQRENIKIRLVKEEKEPIGVADSRKVELAHDYFDLYSNCEFQVDRLVGARRATDKTIDTIRTKISYEKSDQRNG